MSAQINPRPHEGAHMMIRRVRSGMSATGVAAAVCSALLAAGTSSAAEEGKDDKREPSRIELQQELESAQKRLDAAARDVAALSMSMSDDLGVGLAQARTHLPPRAVLGMVIGASANSRTGEGIEVLSVSPGGAAADAGLRAGDVITEINGKALKSASDERPERQFMAAMRGVEPGEKVTLKYLRAGKPATASLEARAAPERVLSFRVPGPGPMPAFPNFAFMRAEGVFGSAQLVGLTPKLGQYFGSDKGLLVVRAPSDARLKLEEGDVIVDIDGRVPSSPSHALQILGSYEAGEKLQLNILRMKKRMSFDITMPEDTAGWSRAMPPEPPDVFMSAPMPPAGPTSARPQHGPPPPPATL
jgi:hypothetical protein